MMIPDLAVSMLALPVAIMVSAVDPPSLLIFYRRANVTLVEPLPQDQDLIAHL